MYSVMIVDDMEIVRLQLKRLKVWGEASSFEITEEARNGHEAFLKLQTNAIDLVITDIRMPMVDGVELLENIMREKLVPCVVLLSEYSEFEYARKGLVLGAFDYLVKPVNIADITKLLERAKLFIIKKKEEEKKLKAYDPLLDIKQVLTLFESGESVENLSSSIFNKLIISENDKTRMLSLIERFTEEMLKVICDDMPWFIKFVDVNQLKNLSDYSLNSSADLRESYFSFIRNLEAKIFYLYFGKSYGSLINKISKFVLQNVESEISLTIISQNLHMNKNYMGEIFKKKTGISFLDYMTRVKMERAKKLLRESEARSYEISDKLGYKDSEYFSKLFKKYSGVSPIEYRKLKKFK